MEYISMPFNLTIILAFSVHTNTIVNTVQFKILNRKCSIFQSNYVQLNPIKYKKEYIRYLKYTHSDRKKFQSILIHSRLLDI